ncbi:uncharacterized protein LOC128956401 [Oppia nitens]|uniref:uncharacterized protein LOC128956401 n=1 Tax=Oppia nitens TaxID=1686743 RepID=UPI0023DA62D0|nr:uncharacterized protein LOC128956401 [Oppia nitens]
MNSLVNDSVESIAENLWPEPQQYPELRPQFVSKSNDQLIQSIESDIENKCQLIDEKIQTFKREGLEFMAKRYSKFGNYEHLTNDLVMADIGRVSDQIQHDRLVRIWAQWTHYLNKYYCIIVVSHRMFTIEQLVQSSDPRELTEKFLLNRNKVMETYEKWIQNDRQLERWEFWLRNDEMILKDLKIDYSIVDKTLANLTPESIKVKTLQYLVYETEIYRRSVENVIF